MAALPATQCTRVGWCSVKRPRTISLASLLAVALSTALVCMTGLVAAAVSDGVYRGVRTATDNADLIVTSSGGSHPLDADLAQQIRELPAVETVTEQLFGIVTDDQRGGAAIGVQTLPPTSALTLVEGRLPASASAAPDEVEAVLIDIPSKPTGYQVGARIPITGPTRSAQSPTTVTVVGVATAAVGAVEHPSIPTLLTPLPTARHILGVPGSTRLLVTTRDDARSARDDIETILQRQHPAVALFSGEEYAAEHASDFTAGSRTIRLTLALLTAAALVAAFVVVASSFNMQLARSTRQIAVLRSIGALRRQVFARCLTAALTVGLVGAMGGCVLGVILAHAVLLFNPDIGDGGGLTPGPLVLGVAAGVIPSLLAALRPAWLATRVAPVHAMRTAATRQRPARRPVTTRVGFTAVIVGLVITGGGGIAPSLLLVATGVIIAAVGLVASAPAVFTGAAEMLSHLGGYWIGEAGAQVRRNPGRSSATGIALWLGEMLLVALAIGASTGQATLADAVAGATPADVFITPASDEAALSELDELDDQVKAMPSVAASTRVNSLMVDAVFPSGESQLTVVGWKSDLLTVLSTDAVIVEPPSGTIIVPSSPGTVDGETVTVHHGGMARELTMRVVDGAPRLGIVSAEELERFGTLPSDYWVKLVPNTDPSAALEALGRLPGVETVSSPAIERAEIAASIRQAGFVAGAFLALSVLIALVGLANTVALSVIERTNEFGLYRALGATRSQVRKQVVVEAVLLAVVASVIGAVYGLVFGVCGARALLANEQLSVVVTVPWGTLVGLLTGVVACAAAAAGVPAHRAAATPPIAALA